MFRLEPHPSRLQYGDGHFTTLRVHQGAPLDWPAHLDRLQEGCGRLHLAPVDWPALTQAVTNQAKALGEGGIKVLLVRAQGGRGYAPNEGDTEVWLSHFALPAHYPAWREQGIRLGLSPVTLGTSPMLAGLKHCNRLEQVLAAQALKTLDCDEAVLLDGQGMLVSVTSANLFWAKGGRLYTPKLDGSGVLGTMRARVMAEADVHIIKAPFEVLLDADEIFITNALMGLVPVRELEGRPLPPGHIGQALCRQLNP
ncbi:aminodeoxychorismate lyase [Gallaecimonas kandeliae]|uniref:aminodeoxychorismate lyase n=1 Tax=Gallaecimonas kandeliae TaxID=3029055 RepID=UPI0026488656|nr:aminodeoxychorismate lyase [Gallaecimonas kandeliae]WKE67387.1 aminodeoxychorismate lyase [Gallaecimonas kandeliae]